MKKNSAFIAIFLGLVCMTTILLIQYIWIKKTIQSQNTEVALQAKEDSLNRLREDLKIHSALRDVLISVSKVNGFDFDEYEAVRQTSNNLYYVEYQGDLNPIFLENTLKREFYYWHINSDFQFAIYNCYSNKIQYSGLIKFTLDSLYESTHAAIKHPDMKFTTDSHYFAVYFPNFVPVSFAHVEDIGSPWLFLFLVSLLIILYLTYSVYTIVNQKKLADIKTDFINNMTHELKTPIATIKLSSNALLTDDFTHDPERLKRYASIIYSENNRLQSQVERVLNIAKMDKKSTPLKKEYVDVHLELQEIAETFNFNLEDIGGSLSLELNAQHYVVFVDLLHFKNIIFNLLENALKYRRDDVELHLELKTKNIKKNLVIEIKDNGIGIRKEDHKLIFDKFFRVPKGDLHDVKGFGLGLYYVKTIVEQHGGTIDLRSTPNVGTTFIISIPLKSHDEEAYLKSSHLPNEK